jgi:hypothetical protein
MIARALGPYQPVEQLARGDSYTGYRASDPRLFGQPVMVLATPLPAERDPFLRRFHDGAGALTGLRHPNILPLLDFGETDEHAYLVSPFLEGPTLAEIGGRRRLDEVLGLIATLCEALDHAQRLSLPHGGLTPAAIQIVNLPPGEDSLYAAWPLLLYHGFAPLLPEDADVVPSPYAPPVAAEGALRGRDDIHALAGVLEQLLTGRVPGTAPEDGGVALPEMIAAVLGRARAVEPGARFASGADFLSALRDAAAVDRRGEEQRAGVLLDEARLAVAAGKLRSASEAYGAYLALHPEDESARREFATVENRRAEIARRRAEAAVARAAQTPVPPPQEAAATAGVPVGAGGATEQHGEATGAAPLVVPVPDTGLRNLLVPGVQMPNPGGVPLGQAGGGRSRATPSNALPRTFQPVASPARQRRRAVLPVAIAAAILILILAVAGWFVARQRANAGAGTPVTTVVSGVVGGSSSPNVGGVRTPTRIATNVPPVLPIAPTIAVPTATIVPTVPPLAPVFNDAFGDPSTGFPREPGGDPTAGYQNGEYIVRVPDPDGFEVAELNGCVLPGAPTCTFGDLVLEADIHAVGATNGGSYGLVFHRQFNGAYVQYFVLIEPEPGTVRLVRWVDTERTEVITPTPLPTIAKGEGLNHLTIAVKGNTFTIGINGTNLPTVTDVGPTAGLVALRADAGTGPIEVHFDNFIIRPAR